MTSAQPEIAARSVPTGIAFVRRLGWPTAFILIALGVRNLTTAHTPPFEFFQAKGIVELLLAAGFLLPINHWPPSWWKRIFSGLLGTSLLYGILTVVGVIFAYMQAARAGGDLGLPAFEGTVLFAVFIQIPAIFFQRHPEQWD